MATADSPRLSRRALLAAAATAGAGLLTACGDDGPVPRARERERVAPPRDEPVTGPGNDDGHRRGLLGTRPRAGARGAAPPGTGPLEVAPHPAALVHVPAGYDPARPVPLVLTLHGAGGTAEHGLGPLLHLADAHGLLLVSPRARRATWDVIMGRYGPDVGAIDAILERVLARYAVDPERIAVSGFSDGASYALSLGLGNGDLFRRILAFSPGFAAPVEQHGAPRVFVTHGTRDEVLPIERCSRRLVPQLRRAGYDVEYREFDGPHTVPPALAEAAVRWAFGTDGS